MISLPDQPGYWDRRPCLREPIAELYRAAALLDRGVGAHLVGEADRAEYLLAEANSVEVRAYVESMWGKRSLWPEQRHYLRLRQVENLPPSTPDQRGKRVSSQTKRMVVGRDGLTCRYCGLPVIPAWIRKELRRTYPDAVPWGTKNELQHAAFQALWLQYDHVVPLARGGANDETNIVVTCGPCNFVKWDYTLDEVGLQDPRERRVLSTSWDGLTRLVGGIDKCLL